MFGFLCDLGDLDIIFGVIFGVIADLDLSLNSKSNLSMILEIF